MKVELHLEKDTNTRFCKARSVNYALCAAVNEELQRLQDADII